MRHWRILDMHGKTSATAGDICFSWTTNGGNGAWTSWPPHEHEKDLEEVYCYFDMDDPHFGLHLSYVEPGDTHGVVAHTVKSGTMILAPRGYHPTVAAPGTRNTYLWVLAAHSHKSRRYDLAVLDPKRAEMNQARDKVKLRVIFRRQKHERNGFNFSPTFYHWRECI